MFALAITIRKITSTRAMVKIEITTGYNVYKKKEY